MITATQSREPLADQSEIVRAIGALAAPGQVVEVRALEATRGGDRRAATYAGYFNDAELLAQAVAELQSADGIYVTMNPVAEALLARAVNKLKASGRDSTTTDAHITARRWMLVDCDPDRPAGIPSSDAEHAAAAERAAAVDAWLSEQGWPAPVIADSGNGQHLLYRIDLPADDGGLVKRCLEALAAKWNGDGVKIDSAVFNPARIIRLYGCVNGKGDPEAAAIGRPQRRARLLQVPETIEAVAGERLERLAAMAPKPAEPAKRTNGHAGAYDLAGFCQRHGLRIRNSDPYNGGTKHVLEECPFNADHKAPDSAIFEHASGAVSFTCLHNSCRQLTWQDLRTRFEPDAYSKQNGHSHNRISQYTERDAPSWAGEELPPDGPPATNGRHATPIKYARITAAELDAAAYSQEFLIDGAMTAGQPLIVAGGKKTLKTGLLCDAAISLARGDKFLGSIDVNRPARVLFMSGESGLATLQETCRRICRAKGFELRDVADLVFSPDLPRIDDVHHHAALEEMIAGDEIEVLILDPAYLCMGGDDAGNLFKQGLMLRAFNSLCQASGVTLILCHHTRKNLADAFKPPELEDIAWAGFQEYARQWWLLGRRERYEPGSGNHRLWLNVGGSAGHSALWALDITEGTLAQPGGRTWGVSLATANEAREQAHEQRQEERETEKAKKDAAKIEAMKERIADALRPVPGHTDTKSSIRERCGCGGTSQIFAEAFAYLLRTGRLTECELTKANRQPYTGYRYAFNDPQ